VETALRPRHQRGEAVSNRLSDEGANPQDQLTSPVQALAKLRKRVKTPAGNDLYACVSL
jgi:hypothetical protein